MRLVLVLALLSGLLPDARELTELAVHYVVSGHVAHVDADEADLADLGDEHGCGPLDHHCGCCASQPTLVTAVRSWEPHRIEPVSVASAGLRFPPSAVRERLFRPPI